MGVRDGERGWEDAVEVIQNFNRYTRRPCYTPLELHRVTQSWAVTQAAQRVPSNLLVGATVQEVVIRMTQSKLGSAKESEVYQKKYTKKRANQCRCKLCRMLSQPEHLVVGFKHASCRRMQGLGWQGGAAIRVNYKNGETKKERE